MSLSLQVAMSVAMTVHRLGRRAAGQALSLRPLHDCGWNDVVQLRCFMAAHAAQYLGHNTLSQVERTGSSHAFWPPFFQHAARIRTQLIRESSNSIKRVRTLENREAFVLRHPAVICSGATGVARFSWRASLNLEWISPRLWHTANSPARTRSGLTPIECERTQESRFARMPAPSSGLDSNNPVLADESGGIFAGQGRILTIFSNRFHGVAGVPDTGIVSCA